ncbi:Holliday junction branch migration protein RuvA [Candidatus Nomurabacteria bacterium]|nr:Holliday junction branch migration protein RuvA [Candidatus Nomurabacteria bacterium]
MIARLEGTIIYNTDKYIVIDVSGVGYKVFVSADAVLQIRINDKCAFWIYTAVRENSIDLYGFAKIEELTFFEMLLDVSGIGPKGALGIISIASIDTLSRAIATGDTGYLTKVSGIGKKTAEKIVIELRDKLKAKMGDNSSNTSLRAESDIIEALRSLGYSQNEARDALKNVPNEIESTNARIKEALKILGNK